MVAFLPTERSCENIGIISGLFGLASLHKAFGGTEVKKTTGGREHRTILLGPKPRRPGLTHISGETNKTIPVGLQVTEDNKSHHQIRLGGFPEMDHFLKRLSKLFVKHSIYYWIDEGV